MILLSAISPSIIIGSKEKVLPKPEGLDYLRGLVSNGIYLLLILLAAGDAPEIKTAKTDLRRRRTLKEGL